MREGKGKGWGKGKGPERLVGGPAGLAGRATGRIVRQSL